MRQMNLILALVILNFCVVYGLEHAICSLQGKGTSITGRVDFYGLCDGDTHFIISASGLELIAEKSYALQIEAFAEQNKPFNPLNRMHGCPENGNNRAVGDLGNLNIVTNNAVQTSFVISQNVNMSLVGANSIIGRYIRLYSVADDCVNFPQTSPSAVVLAECVLGISNEITFSEAAVDNSKIDNGYCAFNSYGVNVVVHFAALNNQELQFEIDSTGLSASNASYTFSIQEFGDSILGFGSQTIVTIDAQTNSDDILNFVNLNLTNLSDIIGHGLIMTDESDVLIGSCVIGVTNASSVVPSHSSAKHSSTPLHSSVHDISSSKILPPASNTGLYIGVGVGAAAVAIGVFGTIFYIKIKNTPGKNLYI